jgi:hypothetical protein
MLTGAPAGYPAKGTNMVGPKVIYLAERAEGLDGDAWIARWREHCEINRTRDYWSTMSRYEQDDALTMPAEVSAVVPGPVDGSKAGTGQVWFRSQKGFVEIGQAPAEDHELIRRDEVETFGRYVEHFSVLTVEQARRETGPQGVKLAIFARDRQGRDRAAFWRAWRSCAASDAVAALLEDATCYIENVAGSHAYPAVNAEAPDRTRFPDYDGVIEIGFRDIDHVTAIARDARHAAGWAAIRELLSEDTQTILVRRVELWNELEGVDWIVDALMNARRELRGAQAYV